MNKMSNILDKIRELHGDDDSQLKVITTDYSKVIVEAPAGYGKTKTLISKIAYDIATNKVKNYEKVLVITFSVNAAYKVKKDVLSQLPLLLDGETVFQNNTLNNKLLVTNYHGFCRRILSKYGYLIHEGLRNLDELIPINNNMRSLDGKILTNQEVDLINLFEESVRKLDHRNIKENKEKYLDIVLEKLIPNNLITYDSILLLTERLFTKYPTTLSFYQKLFPYIVVDEFQDTNLLSWNLLKLLITDKTKILFLGDSLQKIYGFIGAVPNLFDDVAMLYNTEYIHLKRNYRFKDNEKMSLLDKNIRSIAKKYPNPKIEKIATIDLHLYADQHEEAKGIVNIIKSTMLQENASKIALLFRQRSRNLDVIMEILKKEGISFFNGLNLKDDDKKYVEFHEVCLDKFIEFINGKSNLTKKGLMEFFQNISKMFEKPDSDQEALLKLLEVFVRQFPKDILWSQCSFEEKKNAIISFFMSKSLKNYMEHVQENVIVTTVFGAKGLEWDYVIIPDMEKDSFPNYRGMCQKCNYKLSCQLVIDEQNEKDFFDELSVFYVAVTRAKKQNFYTASMKNAYGHNTNISCFLSLPGIQYNCIARKSEVYH
jgi:DNA helicase II / ATP-dependent DNA helicase PcrA